MTSSDTKTQAENLREPVAVCKQVVKEYDLGHVKIQALRGLDVAFYPGFNLIIGPSGSGKSTTLNMIGCLDAPTSGSVVVNGVTVSDFREKERCMFRRHNVGFIFQSFSLIGCLSVYDNIEYPIYRSKEISAKERRERAQRLLEEVGLPDFGKRFPAKLSGGQQQRVAIARALVANPKLVIADEPTASLDSESSALILKLLHRVHEEHGTSIILASHDRNVIEHVSRQYVLRDGVITGEKEL